MPDGGKRHALYLFRPDGIRIATNLIPRAAGLVSPSVISIAIDAHSNWVALGHLGYDIITGVVSKGYWVTTATVPWFPTSPVVQEDELNPTFYGTRIVCQDSGRIIVQRDV